MQRLHENEFKKGMCSAKHTRYYKKDLLLPGCRLDIKQILWIIFIWNCEINGTIKCGTEFIPLFLKVATSCKPQHNTLNLHYRLGPPSLWCSASHIQYQWSQRTRTPCCTWFSLPAFVYLEFFLLWCRKEQNCARTHRVGVGAAATNHQNTTFCCCTTAKCYSRPWFYCLIYFSRWEVGPMGLSRLNPSVVVMWSAHFELNLDVLSILNDTSLSLSFALCLCGPCSLFAW